MDLRTGCIPENQWLQTISEGRCSDDHEDNGLPLKIVESSVDRILN